MAVFVDLPLMFVPVPKIGMFRWFGSATGRMFWSGGGVTGKAFAAATEHAILSGGTTLERTTAGKVLTWMTEKSSYKMTGRLWNFASRQFAKGAAGDVHMFMDLSKVRDGAISVSYTHLDVYKRQVQIMFRSIITQVYISWMEQLLYGGTARGETKS